MMMIFFYYRLQDLAGYGVFLAVGKEFANAFPGRTFLSPLVELLVKSGRNGICIIPTYIWGVVSGFI